MDRDFHIKLLDIILQQTTIILNYLSQSRTLPHILAYTHIFGEFYFNRTPLAPPGTIEVIHNSPNDRVSWKPHGEYDWYILPAIKHYSCHISYIPKTRAGRISDTVESPPNKFNMPHMSSVDANYHAAQDLIYSLQNP